MLPIADTKLLFTFLLLFTVFTLNASYKVLTVPIIDLWHYLLFWLFTGFIYFFPYIYFLNFVPWLHYLGVENKYI